MSANIAHMAEKTYDIAIIGGGIAGAAIAREATLQGKKVILFEKNNFGSGTSSKSSKLIHGGLRYLEVAWSALLSGHPFEFWKNLRFVYLALKETQILAKTWPDLIQEIELLMPIYKHHGRSLFSVFFGTWFYGFLAQCGGGKKGTRILHSAEEVLKLEPGLQPNGLLGGVIVQDHATDDLALVQCIIQDACQRGAIALENTTVTHYRFEKFTKRFEIRTESAEKERLFYATHVVNASGAWVDQVRQMAGGIKSQLIAPVAGSHVEIPKFTHYSVILQAEDHRIFFVINRGSRARIGTTERVETNPDEVKPTDEEIRYLLSSVKTFFPGALLNQSRILSVDAGIRPLARPKRASSAHEISREHEFVKDPAGAVHALGIKLTDHRRAAVELLKILR